jgi:hypothetical protein
LPPRWTGSQFTVYSLYLITTLFSSSIASIYKHTLRLILRLIQYIKGESYCFVCRPWRSLYHLLQ